MMEQNIAFNPLSICFFGADAIMFDMNEITDLIEELRLIHIEIYEILIYITIQLTLYYIIIRGYILLAMVSLLFSYFVYMKLFLY